jgi:hypothetical protein
VTESGLIAACLFLMIGGLGRLVFAMATSKALVGVWERADRRDDPLFFWLSCLCDIMLIVAGAAVLLGWRPFGI